VAFTRESNSATISDFIFSDGNGTVETEAHDGFITWFIISATCRIPAYSITRFWAIPP